MGGGGGTQTTKVELPHYLRGKYDNISQDVYAFAGGKNAGAKGFRDLSKDMLPGLTLDQTKAMQAQREHHNQQILPDQGAKTAVSMMRAQPRAKYSNRFTPTQLSASQFRLPDQYEVGDPFAPDADYTPGRTAFSDVRAGPGFYESDGMGLDFEFDPATATYRPVDPMGAVDVEEIDPYIARIEDSVLAPVMSQVEQNFAKAGRSGAINANTEVATREGVRALAPFAFSEAQRLSEARQAAGEAAAVRDLEGQVFNATHGVAVDDLNNRWDLAGADFEFSRAFDPWQAQSARELQAALSNQDAQITTGEAYQGRLLQDSQFDDELAFRASEDAANRDMQSYSDWVANVLSTDRAAADDRFRVGVTNNEQGFDAFADSLNRSLAGDQLALSEQIAGLGAIPTVGNEERARIAAREAAGDKQYAYNELLAMARTGIPGAREVLELLSMTEGGQRVQSTSGGGASPYASALSGAAGGASIGSAFGPWGTAIGAGVGGIGGLLA